LSQLQQQIEPRARQVLSTPEIYGIRQIIITGSGDSYIAAASVADALRSWTGMPVQAMVAMQASRYLSLGFSTRSLPLRSALVVCVSHSGEAARVVEAAQRTRAAGALTLALTAARDSRLSRATAKVLSVQSRDSSSAPGTLSYSASLLGLYLLGIRMAEVRLRMSMASADALRQALSNLPSAIASSIALCEQPLLACAEAWQGYRSADILGSGPATGSAAYCAAKLIEAVGIHAASQDIEEFIHLNYFVAEPTALPTIVFAAARSAAAGRAAELLQTLQELGRPVLLLTDELTLGPADQTLVLPSTSEWLQPMLDVIPAGLLAAYWADRIGAEYYRGQRGPWRSSQGAALVRDSAIESPAHED
jgi:glucosamine--fructose-6-phosphate aminotransferase (isomerizing)